ncbi:MAG: CocE/NonD family hydrolase [Pseudomonadota bacterium]
MNQVYRFLASLLAVILLHACGKTPEDKSQYTDDIKPAPKLSSFGVYEGYSEERFNGGERQSIYVSTRDGTKIAVDIFFPLDNGVRANEKMPVALTYSGYRRATKLDDGNIATGIGILKPGESRIEDFGTDGTETRLVIQLLRHGYIVAIAGVRGTGASFGEYPGLYTEKQRQDGYDLVEWLAEQDYSNGRVGMFGGSYNGQSLLSVMHAAPPSLKATVPSVAQFDTYDLWAGGTGVFKTAGLGWILSEAKAGGRLESESEKSPVLRIVPVDADKDRTMLKQALEERKKGRRSNPFEQLLTTSPEMAITLMQAAPALGVKSPTDMINLLADVPRLSEILKDKPELSQKLSELTYPREIFSPAEEKPGLDVNLSSLIDGINKSNIPIYHWGGFRDSYSQSSVRWYINGTQTRRLTIGPWTHGGLVDPRDYESARLRVIETRRWFDYWLKDIENGIVDEEPIHFAVVKNPDPNETADAVYGGFEWRTANDWPPSDTKPITFYLTKDASSETAGKLSPNADTDMSELSFDVDYRSTTGRRTRYYDATGGGGPMQYPDMNAHAEGALVYTSEPFSKPLDLFGFPQLYINARSTAPDGIFHAFIEEVDADGKAYYLSNANIRARHAETGEAPFNTAGMPWLVSSKAALKRAKKLNEETVRLPLIMQPIANHFEAGHRLRIVITGADLDNDLFIPRYPVPTHTVIAGGEDPSVLILRTLQ